MKKLLAALALLAAVVPALAAQSLKVTVNGMVCAFCAQGIEKSLSKMDATREVFVDLKHKVVAIEPKPGQTLDRKAIEAAIVDAGYDVVKMETVAQSVEEIKAQSKGSK
jgi:copper chaperone CopZ